MMERPVDPVDLFLQGLTNLLLSARSGVGFTLMVDSHTVSGFLITADEFYLLIDQNLLPQGFGTSRPPKSRRNPIAYDGREFLHLRDVTIILPGGREICSTQCRLPFSRITGWMLGTLPACRPGFDA